jgi:hypothetical protein
MKMKKKLGELKLTSFVTSFNENEENTVQGGAGGGASAKGECPTVITFGYWTYCCGNSGWEC